MVAPTLKGLIQASAICVSGDLTLTGNFGVAHPMNLIVRGSNASGLDVVGNLYVSTASNIDIVGADGASGSGESGKDGMVISGTVTRTAGTGNITSQGGSGDNTASGGNGANIDGIPYNLASGQTGGTYTLP